MADPLLGGPGRPDRKAAVCGTPELAGRSRAWRGKFEVVAMDGFTGFKTPPRRNFPTGSQ